MYLEKVGKQLLIIVSLEQILVQTKDLIENFWQLTIFLSLLGFKFKKEFKNGTVNLVLTCKSVSILRHDYFFQNIKWSPNHTAESFYFIKCVLIKAGIKYPAYIYQPDLKSIPSCCPIILAI